MPDTAEKVVVLSTLVNDWPQGSVIDRQDLVFHDPAGKAPDHDAYERLLAAGAIRPAQEGEHAMRRVPVAGGGLSAEAQLKLGQLDATIEHLARNVAALQDRLAFHRAVNPVAAAAPEEDPAVSAAIAERQARVDHLAAQFEALSAQLNEAQGQTRAGDEAKGKAAQEARGGRDMPTGQATPTGHTEDPASAGGGGAAPSPPPPSQPGQGGAVAPPPAPAFTPPEGEGRPRRGRRGSGGEESGGGE